MTSPDPSAVSVPRLTVYKLAIYGGEDRKPLIAARIAEVMEISEPTVSNHLRELTLAGYVEPYKRMKNPKLYARGRYADLLDERLRGAPNSAPQGGVNVQNWPSGDKNPSAAPLPVLVGETHVDGVYVFPVLSHPNIFRALKVKDDQGERFLEIFDHTPIRWDNGVSRYKGLVPMDEGDVKVEFWAIDKPTLHVWPLPVPTVASTVRSAPDRLREAAERVATIFIKWGGWKLGPPEFVPNEKDKPGYHYACNDPKLMQHFPADYVPPAGSGYRVDATPPPISMECDDPESGEAMMGHIILTRNLAAGHKDLSQQVVELRHQLKELVAATEDVAVCVYNLASAEAQQIERAARGLANDINAEVMSS